MSPTQPAGRQSYGSAQQSWNERLRSNWPLVTIVGVWVLANVVVLFWPSDESDREYYDTYIAIWRDIEGFRSRETDAALWDDFAEQKLAELESIVADLEGDASPDEPSKQQLLWAGRDYLVPILEGKEVIDDDKLRGHMDRVRRRLRREGYDVEPLIREEEDPASGEVEQAE